MVGEGQNQVLNTLLGEQPAQLNQKKTKEALARLFNYRIIDIGAWRHVDSPLNVSLIADKPFLTASLLSTQPVSPTFLLLEPKD